MQSLDQACNGAKTNLSSPARTALGRRPALELALPQGPVCLVQLLPAGCQPRE